MKLRAVILAVAAFALAAFAWRDAAAAYWLANRSSPANPFVQGDPRVALALAEGALWPPGSAAPETVRKITGKARDVLRSAPLQPAAMRDVGLAFERMGRADSRQTLLLAERISRRDQATQAALLRIAASEGLYGPSISHLDKMLTVSPQAASTFLDVMSALVADPEASRTLSAYGNRPWFPLFAQRAIATAPDPGDVAALLRNTKGLRADQRNDLLPRMIDRLVNAGRHDAAREYAIAFGGRSPASLDDFSLNERTADPALGALAWQVTSSGVLQSSLVDDGLDVEVRPGTASDVIRRLTFLQPGKYVLQQGAAKDPSSPDIHLQWQLVCEGARDSAPIWSQVVPLRSDDRAYRSVIEVPAGCPAQKWRLRALADDIQVSARFRIGEIHLAPT